MKDSNNHRRNAIISVILGIFSILLIQLPLAIFLIWPTGIVGIILGLRSLKSPSKKLAIMGVVLCILGFTLYIGTLTAIGWYFVTNRD